MKRFILGSLVLVIGLAVGIAQADPIGLPVKWSQLPDMTTPDAIDVRAEHMVVTQGQVVADDFLCEDPRPIVALRWWGSYLDPAFEPAPGAPPRWLSFEVSYHADDVGAFPSQPGTLLDWTMIRAEEEYLGVDATGKNVYVYDAYLGEEWEQTMGETYWVDIQINHDDVGGTGWPFYTWGWHSSSPGWRDTAARSVVSHTGPWIKDTCHDLAFEVMVPVPGAVILGILGLGVAGIKLRKYA